MAELAASLSEFSNEVNPTGNSILMVNRTEPKPFLDILTEAFENQSVTVSERQIPEGIDNLVCLIDDGEVIATTPLWELAEAFCL